MKNKSGVELVTGPIFMTTTKIAFFSFHAKKTVNYYGEKRTIQCGLIINRDKGTGNPYIKLAATHLRPLVAL